MRKIPKPVDEAKQVFIETISRIQNANLKARLSAVDHLVEAASNEFELAASNASLHSIPSHDTIGGTVSGEEMIAVYTGRMAKKDTPGRPFYDRLMAAPAHGRCPLCGQGIVSTLDHHLPKTSHPTLAVAPLNLIPACTDCNKTKLASVPTRADEETLHPYFDEVDDEVWLAAEVLEGSPAALRFHVIESPNWSDLKNSRVKAHFKSFGLARLYASYAGGELVNLRFGLSEVFDQAGAAAVRLQLQASVRTHKAVHLNSWQAAMFSALADSRWFYTGGFRY